MDFYLEMIYYEIYVFVNITNWFVYYGFSNTYKYDIKRALRNAF